MLANGFSFIRGRGRPRASVFLLSFLTVMIASVSVIAWVAFITTSHRQAARDRARVQAFMAAEAGVEQVISWFNNPGYFDELGDYPGVIPSNYTDSVYNYGGNYPCSDVNGYSFVDYQTQLFEPYVISVSTSSYWDVTGNKAVWVEDVDTDALGRPIPSKISWFTKDERSKIPTCELETANASDPFIELYDEDGDVIAETTSIMLVNPTDFAALGEKTPVYSNRIICKIISTATAPELNGATVTVEALLRENPLFQISSPGAIVSGTDTVYNGQFNIAWGEVWAKANIPLASNFEIKVPEPKDDPWVRVRTEQYLIDESSKEYANGYDTTDGFSPTPIAPPGEGEEADPNYYEPFSVITDDKKLSKMVPYINLQQHQDLPFPNYVYEDVKDTFLSAGLPYFYTGTDGLVYGVETTGPNTGQIVGKSFAAWFNRDPSNLTTYWDTEDMLIFIDSVPVNDAGETLIDPDTGVPVINDEYYPRGPGDPAVNYGQIKDAGNSTHTRGAFFLNANLDYGGSGNPPSDSAIKEEDGGQYVTDPFGNVKTGAPEKIAHNGLMFSWYKVSNAAQRVIYGSVYSVGGFDTGGGPKVYYNYRMKDGSWLPLFQSAVLRTGWAVRTANLPDLSKLPSS